MYGTTIIATLTSIVLIGIISPAAGIMMIAASVFGTLIFFRIQSLSHLPRPKYEPREITLRQSNPYKDFLKTSFKRRTSFTRTNPYSTAIG